MAGSTTTQTDSKSISADRRIVSSTPYPSARNTVAISTIARVSSLQ